jgi:methyl-accepting chemotaxis protein
MSANLNSVATDINQDIAQVNAEAGEISNASSQVMLSVEQRSQMAVHLNGILGRFKV